MPFIFKVVLLIMLPLAAVYLISVAALAVDLCLSTFRHKQAQRPLVEKEVRDESKPHIGNFSQ